ncbi:MAG: hypothetical protein E7773_12955 [Sphingomonas sp.]|uniref:hypothetical protein n=1 Tax=Sphingomonas sp. TaxID=28214 RepID=UPI0012241374|nr:hypothetical protein [Sphingomonas sp.]THD35340.1 MAG: hypothetical protein E7773_12955 [Sphingomonas sp.]
MSFREKIAWISVVTTAIVWGTFFALLLSAVANGHQPGHSYLAGFFGAVVIQVILIVVASIVTAATAPKDASAGIDERDRAIAQGSSAIAYPVLLSGVVIVAACLHLGLTAVGMTYGIMGAIVIAEIVHYGAQIVFYRRARHG